MLKRGVSPRILTAYVLGSAGRTLTSGGELAARLGLDDTWAYFSVKSGTSVVAEPDRSGQPRRRARRPRRALPRFPPDRAAARRDPRGSAGIDPGGRRGRWIAARLALG